jgi:general secretion pathway protein A
MYEAFYGLREKPFSLTPDPRYLYLSRSHGEALDHLLYGVREREGFVVVTGDVGTGKTTMCRALLTRLDARTRTALVLNPMLSEEELLRTVLQDFGLPATGATKKALVDELNAFLVRTLGAGERAVLIVDESQDLSPRLLEQIRLLSNLETEREKLLQIILVGQLGLLELLASDELRQLDQRVSVRCRLRPLDPREARQYVHHRLTVAGGASGVTITPGALRAMHRFSGGVPRLINLAADRALLQGFVDRSPVITARRARQALGSLGGEARPVPGRRGGRVTALAAGLLVGGFLGGWVAAGGSVERVLPGRPAGAPSAATTAPASSVSAGRPFTVLAATYRSEDEAQAVERDLARRGYDAFVAGQVAADGARTYGVLVGRFAAADAARALADRLIAEAWFAEPVVVRAVDRPAPETP